MAAGSSVLASTTPSNQGDEHDVILALVVAAGLVGAVVATLLAGTPDKLPGVALGSSVLLHALRAVGVLIAYMLVVTAVVQAWRGQLPAKFSDKGIEYAAVQAVKDEAGAGVEKVEEAVGELRNEVDELTEEALQPLLEAVADLRARVEELEP